ncbi:MAG TPA: gluconokinase, partial [Gammaproteobacteria bacterium]|nr:gluconokinase [Gammaproteobacteria bacterium]
MQTTSDEGQVEGMIVVIMGVSRSGRSTVGAALARDLRFVHLRGDAETIAARLATRQHRCMPAT